MPYRIPAHPLRTLITAAVAILVGGTLVVGQNSDRQSGKEVEAKRPKLSLRAQPAIAVAPGRIVLTADLVGGADDFEEYYCPTISWQWGDDTTSESSNDCDPYEAGKSQLKRRYTVQHVFPREGSYKVFFHLKRKDKQLASASTTLQIQPGIRDPNPY